MLSKWGRVGGGYRYRPRGPRDSARTRWFHFLALGPPLTSATRRVVEEKVVTTLGTYGHNKHGENDHGVRNVYFP